MTAESLPEVTLHPLISFHVYRFPFLRFPSVHVAYPCGNPAVNSMKHEESLRAEKNLLQRHKASSVSVLRSPLHTPSKSISSSNQTVEQRGFTRVCVFEHALINIREFTSTEICWIVRNSASEWILDVSRNLKNYAFASRGMKASRHV